MDYNHSPFLRSIKYICNNIDEILSEYVKGLTSIFQNHLKQVILYGDIPAIAYLFDMAPAIFTTWVDLDSNSIEILEEELHTLSNNRTTSSTPVIILGRTALENQTQIEKLALQKYELILQFARENGYRQCFQNKEYCVLVQSETK